MSNPKTYIPPFCTPHVNCGHGTTPNSRQNPQQTPQHTRILYSSLSYTFSAKEKDAETGFSYFGSRYYSSDLSIWLSVDPMSDKYPWLSPYVYCANNPVKLVDPNGMKWETPEDEQTAGKLKEKAEMQRDYYIERINHYSKKYDNAKSERGKRNNAEWIDYYNCLMEEISQGIDGLEDMGNSDIFFHFEEVELGEKCYVKREVKSPYEIHISINSDNLIETCWHECKHVQDWLNNVFPIEEHGFDKDGILGNTNPEVETRAYRSEYAFSRRRFDGLILHYRENMYDIIGDQRVNPQL